MCALPFLTVCMPGEEAEDKRVRVKDQWTGLSPCLSTGWKKKQYKRQHRRSWYCKWGRSIKRVHRGSTAPLLYLSLHQTQKKLQIVFVHHQSSDSLYLQDSTVVFFVPCSLQYKHHKVQAHQFQMLSGHNDNFSSVSCCSWDHNILAPSSSSLIRNILVSSTILLALLQLLLGLNQKRQHVLLLLLKMLRLLRLLVPCRLLRLLML